MAERQVATSTTYFPEEWECVKAVSTIHFSQLSGIGPSSLSYSFKAASMTLRPGSSL